MYRQPRILIIDDDPQLRSLLQALLRKDYVVFVASDGEQGYQKARQHPPDVAIIDVQMEGWNGLRTLQAFRADETLADVRVMMLTGDARRETVTQALQDGADDYVIKTSFSREEFFAKIAKLCDLPHSRSSRKKAASKLMSEAPVPAAPRPKSDPDDPRLIQSLVDHWE